MDARVRRVRDRDRLLSADRGALQADATVARSAERAPQPGRRDHERTDDRPRQGRPLGFDAADRLQRLHQRPDGGRRCMAATRARHRASDAAAQGRARAGRRGHSRRRPHESDRAGYLVEARAPRADREGHRRPRRAFHRLQRDVSGGRHARSLHALARAGISSARGRLHAPLRAQVRAVRLPQGSLERDWNAQGKVRAEKPYRIRRRLRPS
jgi:hypothetical protein